MTLARILLTSEVAENPQYIYPTVDLYQDVCLEQTSPEVKAVARAYSDISRANRRPMLCGDAPARIEAELIRDWFLSNNAIKDSQLALPDVVREKVLLEHSAAWWIAFGGGYDLQTCSGSARSVAGRLKAGVHLQSWECLELLLELFAALN